MVKFVSVAVVAGLGLGLLVGTSALGQQPGVRQAANINPVPAEPAAPLQIPPNHPLIPALDMAKQALQKSNAIPGYQATFVKREEIKGKLTEPEFMNVKVRHQPFSVYLYCLGPDKPKGQEAIYVEGRNNNMVTAHSAGIRAIAGTLTLEPNSERMMDGNRYPITNLGVQNLIKKQIALLTYETQFGEAAVRIIPGAKVDNRVCTAVEVTHPVPRRNFKFHKTLVYYDDQLGIPLRFEAYTWPTREGEKPALVEEYTYQKLTPDPGLSDVDFDPKNPNYAFR